MRLHNRVLLCLHRYMSLCWPHLLGLLDRELTLGSLLRPSSLLGMQRTLLHTMRNLLK